MGVRYARSANAVLPGKLDLAPRRVLVAMALRVLDAARGATPAGVYYGGRNRLLGDLAMIPTPSAERHLREHIAVLMAEGLVQKIGTTTAGRAVYKLTIPVDNSPPPAPSKRAQGGP